MFRAPVVGQGINSPRRGGTVVPEDSPGRIAVRRMIVTAATKQNQLLQHLMRTYHYVINNLHGSSHLIIIIIYNNHVS